MPLPPPDAPLSTLKAVLSERTGLTASQMKLVMHGQIMKVRADTAHRRLTTQADDMPLSRYGLVGTPKPSLTSMLRSGFGSTGGSRPPMHKIGLIGSADSMARVSDRPDLSNPTSRSASPLPPSAAAAGSSSAAPQYADEAALIAHIESLEATQLAPLVPRIDRLEAEPPTDRREYGFVSEALLQILVKQYDAIDIPRPDWTRARAARKEAVRRLQAQMDRVDALRTATAPSAPSS